MVRLHRLHQDPPTYLAVAVLMYRLIVATALPRSGDNSNFRPLLSWDKQVHVLLARRSPQPLPEKRMTAAPFEPTDADREHERAALRTVEILSRTTIEILNEQHDGAASAAKSGRLIASRTSPEVLSDLRNRVRINAFGIHPPGEEDQDVGLGIFSVAHFANHSCRPNSRATYRLDPGRLPVLELEALPGPERRPDGEDEDCPAPAIRAHEAVTLSYIPTESLALPKDERRALVLDYFGFPCGCERCRSGN
jgi:hypothetical protein